MNVIIFTILLILILLIELKAYQKQKEIVLNLAKCINSMKKNRIKEEDIKIFIELSKGSFKPFNLIYCMINAPKYIFFTNKRKLNPNLKELLDVKKNKDISMFFKLIGESIFYSSPILSFIFAIEIFILTSIYIFVSMFISKIKIDFSFNRLKESYLRCHINN